MVNNPKSLYEKLKEASTYSDIQEIKDFVILSKIRCHLPCKVRAVDYGTRTVEVEIQGKQDMGYGSYESFPILSDIPILEPHCTSKAYFITPIQVGDTGLLEFMDFNCSNFNNDGNIEPTIDHELHSLNSSVFINGYIPQSNVVAIDTSNPITMGLNNQTFTLYVDDNGNLNITAKSIKAIADTIYVQSNGKLDIKGSKDINISGGNIKLNKNTTIDGKSFLQHTHSNGNQGNPTGGVI